MTAMHLRVAGFLSFGVVLWHWCNGQNIPEDLQKDNITTPNMSGQEPPTNKTIAQLIMEAMGGHKDTLNVQSMHDYILMEQDMLLSKQQYYNLYQQPNRTLIRSKRKVIRIRVLRWPNGVTPYRFYPGHFAGCQNKHKNSVECDRWAFNGYCKTDPLWMIPNCLKSCRAYDKHIITKKAAKAPTLDIGCSNFVNDSECDSWAASGECDKNPSMMLMKCRKSCGQCNNTIPNTPTTERSISTVALSPTTKNSTQNVIGTLESLSYQGELEPSYPDVKIVNKMCKSYRKCDQSIQCSVGYVDKNCQCICKNGSDHCQFGDGIQPSGNCTDKYDEFQCQTWARAGECEKNTTWMVPNCQNSCGKCSVTENGPHIWVIAIVAGLIVAVVIIVTVIIVRKRLFTRNEYEVPVNINVHDRQSHMYSNLNLPPPT